MAFPGRNGKKIPLTHRNALAVQVTNKTSAVNVRKFEKLVCFLGEKEALGQGEILNGDKVFDVNRLFDPVGEIFFQVLAPPLHATNSLS